MNASTSSHAASTSIRCAPKAPSRSLSAEDTFDRDRPLDATSAAIEQLAHRVWERQLRERRIGRTVVLKLKTADFRILTRSTTPIHPPDSAAALARTALELRRRVNLPASTRYRLVGVGLSHFDDAASAPPAQPDLFGEAS